MISLWGFYSRRSAISCLGESVTQLASKVIAALILMRTFLTLLLGRLLGIGFCSTIMGV